MDVHQAIVMTTLAAKSSADTPMNTCWEARAETMVACAPPSQRFPYSS
jgi:hypothetical protein